MVYPVTLLDFCSVYKQLSKLVLIIRCYEYTTAQHIKFFPHCAVQTFCYIVLSGKQVPYYAFITYGALILYCHGFVLYVVLCTISLKLHL